MTMIKVITTQQPANTIEAKDAEEMLIVAKQKGENKTVGFVIYNHLRGGKADFKWTLYFKNCETSFTFFKTLEALIKDYDESHDFFIAE